MSTPMPVMYLSHGAPPLADDAIWTDQLARWSADLPRPSAILVISAHWEELPLTLGATTTAPLTYDFWGFPERYYQVTYEAPGAPELADKVRALLSTPQHPVHDAPLRGLDHGAYVPLVEMFPAADVPTLQISMPTLDPMGLYEIGRRLRPLRDEGVLILGSGFTTHNLRLMDMSRGTEATPAGWSSEFDDWAERAIADRDVDALIDFLHRAPAARLAHPRTEHFAPLFVSLGASMEDLTDSKPVIDGFWTACRGGRGNSTRDRCSNLVSVSSTLPTGGKALPITRWGEPVMHAPCAMVTTFDDELRSFVADMVATMYAADGVGLAANQVGYSRAIFVFDCPDDDHIRHTGVVCNPVLSVPEGRDRKLDDSEEGCLSLPGAFVPCARATYAVVSGVDLDGRPVRFEGSGLLARCLQHESDHIGGTVFGDRLANRARKRLFKEADRFAADFPPDWPA